MGTLWRRYFWLRLEARDIVNWIQGGDFPSFKAAETRIGEVNTGSVFDKRASLNFLNNRSAQPEQQFTFGGRKVLQGKGMSPKTHLDGDSNFDEFLQKFDRDRAEQPSSEHDGSRVLGRGGSDKLRIPRYRKTSQNILDSKNLNDDSDLLHLSTERSQDNGYQMGQKLLTPGNSKRKTPQQGDGLNRPINPKGSEAKDEYKLGNRKNGSFDALRGSKGATDSNDQGGIDKKKNMFMDLDNLFHQRQGSSRGGEDKSEEIVTPIKVIPNTDSEKDWSLKNSIVLFEQEIQNLRNKATGKAGDKWKSARNPENLSETREVTRENAQIHSARAADLFLTKSNKSPNSVGISKQKKCRFYMTPLNIQKFCRIVEKAFQRNIFSNLAQIRQSRREQTKFGCISLLEMFIRKRRNLGRVLFASIKDLPYKSHKLTIKFSILESLLSSFFKEAKQRAFTAILADSLVKVNSHLKAAFKKLHNSPETPKGSAYLKAANLEIKKIDALSRVLRRNHHINLQALRRAFNNWVNELDTTPINQKRKAFRKLDSLMSHRQTSDLLKGYYGIKAAGGRLDKLFIIVSKKLKIYTAKTKYCFKKLRIWNKFKSNVSEDYGNVKTIIVRTVDAADSHRSAQLARIFLRKGFETLRRVFQTTDKHSISDSYLKIKKIWSKDRQILKCFKLLHMILYWKPLKQGWIELSIFNLQQNTIKMVTSNKKETYYESPNGKQRPSNKSISAVLNPLFKYIEERSHERPTFFDHESNNTNLSSEIEIFKSGLDLDEKLRRISNSKQLQGAKSLELALKADHRFGGSSGLMRASHLRALLLCLQKIAKRRLHQGLESIFETDTRDKMKRVAAHFLSFGLEKTEKLLRNILLRPKYSVLRQLKSLHPIKSVKDSTSTSISQKESVKKSALLTFPREKPSRDRLVDSQKGKR